MKIVQVLIKKIPPVNGEVLVDLKNIESTVTVSSFIKCSFWVFSLFISRFKEIKECNTV